MDHIRTRGFECLDLVVTEMNAMREGDVTTGQSEAIQIRDVPQSTLLLDELTLGPVFRRMSVS